MTAGHLVAGLHATLDRQIHLDHLEHAGSEIIPGRDLGLLLLEALLECPALRLEALRHGLQLRIRLFVLQADFEPLLARQIREILLVDLRAALELARACLGRLAFKRVSDAEEQIVLENALLVREVLAHPLELRLFDGQCTRILLDAIAGEHPHVDHRAVHARGHAQRGIFYVRSLFTENRPQQFLFRCQLGLALRRDLADQDIARADFRTDESNACFVELGERRITNVGNVGGDFLRAQLRVARDTGQLFDMDRREAVFLDDTLGDQDRVLEVIAVPRHERDQQVLAEREFPQIRGRTIGEHIAALDRIARYHEGPLVDAGVLVGTGVLGQRVDIDAGFSSGRLVIVDAHDNTRGVDRIDAAATARHHRHTGVDRNRPLHPGADQRRVRAQRGHRLALHVRSHERSVGIIMLEERDQRSGDRHDLLRRDVHEVDLARRGQREFILRPAGDQVIDKLALFVQRRVCLCNHVLAFLDRRQIIDLVRDLAVRDTPIRRLEEAVVVRARIHGERIDQADIRAFRGLDRADPAVMGRMHVAHFESGALARQAPWAQGRDAPLVRDFRERIVLVHELRELR